MLSGPDRLDTDRLHAATGESGLNGSAKNTTETVSFATFHQPPFEEQLLTSTLWPEYGHRLSFYIYSDKAYVVGRTEKLYGHGYEINAIAASHDGVLIASACRASNAEHAVIRIHQTSNWAQVMPPLAGHTLTITAIRFSPDDRFILTASRDRSWQLYERSPASAGKYEKAASGQKAHARIIWDCCWADDGSFFATASRDKQVKIWSIQGGDSSTWHCTSTLSFADATTALATIQADQQLLAVGTESGTISIFGLQNTRWSELMVMPTVFVISRVSMPLD